MDKQHSPRISCLVLAPIAMLLVQPVSAGQIDIHGPPGSESFGHIVKVLPNGNYVVTDPGFDGMAADVGAVYLYAPDGNLISTLTGNTANDRIGSGEIFVAGNGNFVVNSSHWSNGAAANAGAVTWIDGSTGLDGVVTATNSLVGTQADDEVGDDGVIALANGNYVVISLHWHNGTVYSAGAVTWGDGNSGGTGVVSAANSLVGSQAFDSVGLGGVVALANGNYVVVSPGWDNGAVHEAGAVTWGDGSNGTSGTLSALNSLVGSQPHALHRTEGVVALANGNYVVANPYWSPGTLSSVGAVTWGNGTIGTTGFISAANSLVGSQSSDRVGDRGVVALTNGHYVVVSTEWNNGAVSDVGAVTWGNGNGGTSGQVSDANSLLGSQPNDHLGDGGVVALANGNYVVASPNWSSGTVAGVGAVTWVNGSGVTAAVVSASNSLVGEEEYDSAGSGGVTDLANGNYVVASPGWNEGFGPDENLGAVTWGNGSIGMIGPISSSNSLVGYFANDHVGNEGATALSDSNYVVASREWNGFLMPNDVGAVTWGDGAGGTTGLVATIDSLVGSSQDDQVGAGSITALNDGAYVVASLYWNNGSTTFAGAVTWCRPGGCVGEVSVHNSLVGTNYYDFYDYSLQATGDGHYVVTSPKRVNGALDDAGAVTLASSDFPLVGTIAPWNSVLGGVADGGDDMNWDYDPARDRLLVGRPAENIVSLFTMDQIFYSGLE